MQLDITAAVHLFDFLKVAHARYTDTIAFLENEARDCPNVEHAEALRLAAAILRTRVNIPREHLIPELMKILPEDAAWRNDVPMEWRPE